MSDQRTASMLQRLPVILAVTAGSYGLDIQALERRRAQGAHRKHAHKKPMAAHRPRTSDER